MNEFDFSEQDWGADQPMTRRDCSRIEPFSRPADRPPRIRRVIRVRPDGAYVEKGEQGELAPLLETTPVYEPMWTYGGQQGPLNLTCNCGGPSVAPPVCPPSECRPPMPPAIPGPTGPAGPMGPTGPMGPVASNAFLAGVDPVVGGQSVADGQNLIFALAAQGGASAQLVGPDTVQLAPGAYLALLRGSVSNFETGPLRLSLLMEGEPVPGGSADIRQPEAVLSALISTQGGRLTVLNQGTAAHYQDLSLTVVRLDG